MHWCRDRTRGERFDLPWRRAAPVPGDGRATVGLLDRGMLAPGYRADVNVIDFDGSRLHPPHLVFDLPAGGKRLLQEPTATGTRSWPAKRSTPTASPTGALPGRLVRGAQSSSDQ